MTHSFDSGEGLQSDDTLLGSVASEKLIPERPWTWSIPVVRIGSWSIRLHVTMLAFVLLQILRTFLPASTGPLPSDAAPMIVSLVALIWLAAIHDFAREFVSRRCGADESPIMIWPAGGISWRQPSDSWANRLACALAGPVALLIVGIALALFLRVRLGVWRSELIPMPLSLAGMSIFDGDRLGSILWLVLWTDVMILAASLVPMHPFVGGRIIASLLEVRFGFDRAQRISLLAGIVIAILVAIIAMAANSLVSLLLALVALTVAMAGARQLKVRESDGFSSEFQVRQGGEHRADERRNRDAQRAADKAQVEEQKVDSILRKIAASGMQSLSWSERRLLKNATRRKRM